MGIFATKAPILWAAGLPAIPIMRPTATDRNGEPLPGRGKRPAIKEWQIYGTRMPEQSEMDAWLQTYPDGNIGLPMGPASGIVAVDIDSDDQRVVEAVLAIAGESPWVRIGRHGMVLAYRYSGEAIIRIDHRPNAMPDEKPVRLMEILGRGAQIVLNDSIHPNTGLPYVANAELPDVMGQLRPLPADFEMQLRFKLQMMGFDIVEKKATSGAGSRVKLSGKLTPGMRDTGLTQKAGSLAGMVLRGEYTLQRAIDEMIVQVRDYTDNADGEVDAMKHIETIVRFLVSDIQKGARRLAFGWDEGLDETWADVGNQLRNVAAPPVEKMEAELNEKIAESSDGLTDEFLIAFAKRIAAGRVDEYAQAKLFKRLEGAGIKEKDFKKLFLKPALREAKAVDVVSNQRDAARDYIQRKDETGGLISWSAGQVMSWNGAYWTRLTNEVMLHEMEEMYGDTLKKHGDYVGAQKMVAGIVHNEHVAPAAGVNFFNGFLGEDGVLREHAKEWYQTYVMPFSYRPEAADELVEWPRFLESIWGRDPDYVEKVKALQFAMCATVMGLGTRFQRCILLYGRAETGKSTLLEVIRGMMPPEACCEVRPQLWKQRFSLVPMDGKILNAVFELEENERIDGAIFKQVIEGSGIQVEQKNEKAYTMRPVATHWFASNHVPRGADTSRGFTRRWTTLTFNWPIDPKKKDPGLKDKLIAEREGIFAWVMQAREAVLAASDFPVVPSSQEIEDTMRGMNNPVWRFLRDQRWVRGPGLTTIKAEMYNQFTIFQLQEHDRHIISATRFDELLKDLAMEFDIVIDRHAVVGIAPRKPGMAVAA